MPRVLNKHRDHVSTDAVSVMRGTPYGNPFIIGRDGTRSIVIHRFRTEVLPSLDVSALRGKDLVCCCVPQDCHAHSILEKANR